MPRVPHPEGAEMSIEMAPASSPAPASNRSLLTGYALLFVGAVILFFVVRGIGET